MVKSLKAKQEYKSKIRLYKKYSQKYFEDSVPIVSDYEFDLLKKEIISLEKKFNFDDPESPSRTLGFKPSKNFVTSRIKTQYKKTLLVVWHLFENTYHL